MTEIIVDAFLISVKAHYNKINKISGNKSKYGKNFNYFKNLIINYFEIKLLIKLNNYAVNLKGLCHAIFNHFLLKDSTLAPYEQTKTVSRRYWITQLKNCVSV